MQMNSAYAYDYTKWPWEHSKIQIGLLAAQLAAVLSLIVCAFVEGLHYYDH